MAKTISQAKSEKVAKLMTSDLKEKSVEAEILLNKEISLVISENAPADVLKFWVKYPEYIKKACCFHFRINENNMHWADVESPYYGLSGDECNRLIEEHENKKYYHKLYFDMRAAQKKYNEMFRKIECALNILRTYNRIKENFPEAYVVLIEKVDKETLTDNSENLCDSVENIRAQLNVKK